MAVIAGKLNAVKPHPPGRQPVSIKSILEALGPVDRDAVHRALTDRDDEYDCYRVSARVLADVLTEAGHKVVPSTITRWRQKNRETQS